MASSPKIDLSCLSHDKDTDSKAAARETKILDVLSAAVNGRVSAECAHVASTAATDLDNLYQAEEPDAVEDFLWSLWMLLIATVKKVPADDARQQLLVETVAQLTKKRDMPVKLWGQETKVWSELPMLGPCMRDAWNLRPKLNGSDEDNGAIREWISLNSFAARMFGQRLQTWVNFAIWELRAALEEQLPEASPTTAKDASLATACEWIMHAGEELHAKSLETQNLDEMEKRALKPGQLLGSQTSGLSNERWTFWRERLGTLGAGAGSGELKDRAQKAAEKMQALEG